jgi:hypothetical protein
MQMILGLKPMSPVMNVMGAAAFMRGFLVVLTIASRTCDMERPSAFCVRLE